MSDLKTYLYQLTSELNKLRSAKRNLLERHVISVPSEVQIQISELEKMIQEKENQIKEIL